MLEIVLTPKILRLPEIGGPRLKPFQPNGKSAPALGAWIVWKAISLKKCRKYNFLSPRHITVVINRCQGSGNMLGLEQWLGCQPFLAHGPSFKKNLMDRFSILTPQLYEIVLHVGQLTLGMFNQP